MAKKTIRKKKFARTRKISNMKEYEVFYGVEPTWYDEYEDDADWKLDIRKSFQWYNLAPIKSPEKKKWLIEFLTKNDYEEFSEDFIKQMKGVPDSYLLVAGATARMLSRGAEFPEKDYDKFIEILNRVKENQEEISPDEKPVKAKPDIQAFIRAQVADYIGEVENQLCDFVDAGYVSEFSMYTYLNENEVKGLIAGKVKLYFLDEYNSFCDVVNEEDEFMVESYSHMKPKQRDKYLQFLGEIVDDLESHIQNCSANKKPHKSKVKKQKSPDKLIAKLNYLAEDVNLKLKSIRPEKIIGATELWTYNTTGKILTVYRANNRDGLTLSGSTLKGYDEKECLRKSLRKPELFFSTIGSGQKKIFRELQKLKTKEKPINGRINKTTIILKSY